MLKEVEIEGEKYQIDTTPITSWGHRGIFAEVLGIHDTPTGGVLSLAWENMTGRRLQNRTYTFVEQDELSRVVLELGHKFSTSKAWKSLYDDCWIREYNKERIDN